MHLSLIQVCIQQPLTEWQQNQRVCCGFWEGAVYTHHQESDMVNMHRHLGKEGEGMPFSTSDSFRNSESLWRGLQTFYSGAVESILKGGHHQLVWELLCSSPYSALQWVVCLALLSIGYASHCAGLTHQRAQSHSWIMKDVYHLNNRLSSFYAQVNTFCTTNTQRLRQNLVPQAIRMMNSVLWPLCIDLVHCLALVTYAHLFPPTCDK